MAARRGLVVLKLGGELLEDAMRLRRMAAAIGRLAARQPLVVVHGGGREIDAEMARHGLEKHSVDGLRITDAPTLDVVVGVLAGRVNTRLVAAVNAAGARAVGLTGADAGVSRVKRSGIYRASDGSRVDLGYVGRPVANGRSTLLRDLCRAGYVPVVASIGADRRGQLFNVNADTLAGHLAGVLGAERLIMAGATAGVLDADGNPVARVDDRRLSALIASGTASAGMVAKLLACRNARRAGVRDVAIVDGRKPERLARMSGTSIVAGG